MKVLEVNSSINALNVELRIAMPVKPLPLLLLAPNWSWFLLKSRIEVVSMRQYLEQEMGVMRKKQPSRLLSYMHRHRGERRSFYDLSQLLTHLQLSLNCLIILLIFSNLWTSRCSLFVLFEITRNVARSKRTTSDALIVLLNSSSWASITLTLGIRLCTIDDHARYRVSSQIEVMKKVGLNASKRDERSCFRSLKTLRRCSTGIRSILWMRTKSFDLGEYSARACRQDI